MADFGATRMILPQEQNYDLSNLTYLPGVTRRSTRSQAIGAGGRYNDTSQRPQINIPPAARSFVDLNTAYFNFTLTVTVASPSGNAHDVNPVMIGSAASIFREINWYSNSSSQLLENVGNYAQLTAMLRNLSYHSGASDGQIALLVGPGTPAIPNLGYSLTDNTDIDKATGGSVSMDCYVPVMGAFAANSKFLPIFQAEHNCFIDLNPIDLWLRNAHASGGAAVDLTGVSYQISELMLLYDTVTLDPATFDSFRAAYPPPAAGLPSILPIRTVSYEYREQLIPLGTTNFTWSLPLHISSIRRFFFCWNRNQVDSSGLIDGNLGSINPNLRNIMVRANGVPFPQSGLDCTKPTTVIASNLTSFGALHTPWCYNPMFDPTSFLRRDTATGGGGVTDYASGAYLNPAAQAMNPSADSKNGNCFYVIIDTEALQNRDDLVSGIAAQGASVFVEMQMATATTKDWNMRCWVEHDRIVQYDLNSPMVAVKY